MFDETCLMSWKWAVIIAGLLLMKNFPAELEVTARDENSYIMALQHKKYDVQGVQFHPESVLTPMGEKILRNWLNELNQ